jgi:hypothetical protein
MPVGIGRLSRLEKLDLFVVGKDQNSAQISELGNLGSNIEYLTISHIECAIETNDAHKPCLKQKTNLQRLKLDWGMYYAGEVNTELVHGVLDDLEPPSGLKELRMFGYPGMQYAQWMHDRVGGGVQGLPVIYFPSLRVMELFSFPNLKHLRGLAELPCLEELFSFPNLKHLRGMPSLGDVWLVADRTNKKPDGEEGGGCISCTPHLGQVLYVGNCLSYLSITLCSKLKVKPYLPWSIQMLSLRYCSEHLLQSPCDECQGFFSSPSCSHLKEFVLRKMTGCGRGWELLQHMKALESLEIVDCEELTELPESMGSLASLRSLQVWGCSAIRELPESLGELRSLQELTILGCSSLSSLPLSMGDLTSLQTLEIGWCGALEQLPECLGGLRSLREFEISQLPKLTCLPQSMSDLSSLVELTIEYCPGITSLPEGIKDLTALRRLRIFGCREELNRRCERGKGEDWHLISHIRDIYIW